MLVNPEVELAVSDNPKTVEASLIINDYKRQQQLSAQAESGYVC
jgi:hypothetical protein